MKNQLTYPCETLGGCQILIIESPDVNSNKETGIISTAGKVANCAVLKRTVKSMPHPGSPQNGEQ